MVSPQAAPYVAGSAGNVAGANQGLQPFGHSSLSAQHMSTGYQAGYILDKGQFMQHHSSVVGAGPLAAQPVGSGHRAELMQNMSQPPMPWMPLCMVRPLPPRPYLQLQPSCKTVVSDYSSDIVN